VVSVAAPLPDDDDDEMIWSVLRSSQSMSEAFSQHDLDDEDMMLIPSDENVQSI